MRNKKIYWSKNIYGSGYRKIVVGCFLPHNIILPFLFNFAFTDQKFLLSSLLLLLFNSQRVTLDNVHTLFHAMKIVFFVLLMLFFGHSCCLPFAFYFILLLCEESHNTSGSPIILSIWYYSFECAGGIA